MAKSTGTNVGTLGVEVVASLEGFRAEMAKMGPEGDKAGAALVASLAKQLRKTEAAAIRAKQAALAIGDSTAGAATRKTTEAVQEIGAAGLRSAGQMRQASQMISSNLLNIGNSAIATRGNLLSMSAALPDVIMGLSQAGIGASTLIPGLGAVAAALGAGYFVWRQYASGTELAAKATERAKAANEGIVGTFGMVEDRLIRLALRTGNLTQEEADLALARRSAEAEYKKTASADERRVEQLDRLKRLTVSERMERDEANKRIATASALKEQAIKVGVLEAAATRIETEEAKGLADALELERRSLQSATEAREADAAWIREQVFLIKLEEEAVKERAAARAAEVVAEDAALESLQAKRRAIRQEQFRDQDAIQIEAGKKRDADAKAAEKDAAAAARKEEELDLAREERARGFAAEGVAVAQQAVDLILQYRLKQMEDYSDRIEQFEVAITEATSAQEKRRLEIRRDSLQKEEDARRSAVMKAFAASKALAMTQAVIAGILGAIQSIGAYGATPVGVAAAALAGLAAASSVAAIAAEPPPTFHSGGAVERAFTRADSDERTIRVTRPEAVLTGAGVQNVGGKEEVARINAGVSSGPAPVYVTVLDGRTYDIQTERSLRRRSGPLQSFLAGVSGLSGSWNPYGS